MRDFRFSVCQSFQVGETSFKIIDCLWPHVPRLGEYFNWHDPSLLGHVPLTLQEGTSTISVAGNWSHQCVYVWSLNTFPRRPLQMLIFMFNSPCTFCHPFLTEWILLHIWRQAREGRFFWWGKYTLWARPSAVVNHACSAEATGYIPAYFTEEVAMCSFWPFFF